MSSLSIKLFEKGYVGFAERETESGTPLGFLTPWGEDTAAVKRMATVDRWASKKLKAAIIDNEPVSGFRISDYSRRGGWRNTGATMIRIEDPRGFELEIGISNLIQVMSENTVINGEIMVPCTWGRDGADNVLLPITSEPYQDAILNTERLNMSVTLREVKIGNKIELKDGRIGIYCGPAFRIARTSSTQYQSSDSRPYYARQEKETATISIGHDPKKNYAVLITGTRDNDCEPHLELNRSLKIARVVEATTLTLAEAEVKMNQYKARFDHNVIAYVSSVDYTSSTLLEDTTIAEIKNTTTKATYGGIQYNVVCQADDGVAMLVASHNFHNIGESRRYTVFGHLGTAIDYDVYGQRLDVTSFLSGKYQLSRSNRYDLTKDDQVVHYPESQIVSIKRTYAVITSTKTGVVHKCNF